MLLTLRGYFTYFRPYGIPKRDEEAETQRKARAKRARETRRSTQVSGSSLVTVTRNSLDMVGVDLWF